MFTGIIKDTGIVHSRGRNRLVIQAPQTAPELGRGDSVAVNGVCVTVVSNTSDTFSVDLLDETLSKTNLGKLKKRDLVNLEPALRVGDRLGGHIVTGHADGTGKMVRRYKKGNDTVIEVELHRLGLAGRIRPKDSIAVNGISFTIVRKSGGKFTVHVIPHTLNNTNLIKCRPGTPLNIELDKYMQGIK